MSATVLIVPGLREQVEQHWQTLLANELHDARSVPPMGREDLNCARRVHGIEAAVSNIKGPLVLVAHSGGCIMLAHWAKHTGHGQRVQGALLATPPDFESPMPEGYPSIKAWWPSVKTTPWAVGTPSKHWLATGMLRQWISVTSAT
jgi:predicted alpha/beta hydrolase family esterase